MMKVCLANVILTIVNAQYLQPGAPLTMTSWSIQSLGGCGRASAFPSHTSSTTPSLLHADDFDEEYDQEQGPASIKLVQGSRIPKAPAPKAAPASAGAPRLPSQDAGTPLPAQQLCEAGTIISAALCSAVGTMPRFTHSALALWNHPHQQRENSNSC
jgi:hypothetical protein